MANEFIVVGSGAAGLYAALLGSCFGEVLLLTKARLEDSNSRSAQGGIAVAMGDDDSPALHEEDTLRAGAGLCDAAAVRVLTEEGPGRVQDMVALGVPFDREGSALALTREGAHSVYRVVHAGGDATGLSMESTLASRARQSEHLRILENHLVTQIIVKDGQARGVRALDEATGQEEEFFGRQIILATGGAGQLFAETTNPDVATGDGVAVAYLAGAAIADAELLQFHPTALAIEGAPRFLISESLRGEGGILRNTAGERFMERYDPRGELAPRDVVARAIVAEADKTGSRGALLDMTHLDPAFLARRFPTIDRVCKLHGIDMAQQPIPVAPAAHYFMGGIRTDVWGETTIPGLYACGECACTGVHGANRLASNSLLETIVFAHRIIERCTGQSVPDEHLPADDLLPEHTATLASLPSSSGEAAPERAALRRLLWQNVGLARQAAGLVGAAGAIDRWIPGVQACPRHTREDVELYNMLIVGRLMTQAALLREESRGAHYRTDFPQLRPEWRRRIVFRQT